MWAEQRLMAVQDAMQTQHKPIVEILISIVMR
jgi:hypothetical protein